MELGELTWYWVFPLALAAGFALAAGDIIFRELYEIFWSYGGNWRDKRYYAKLRKDRKNGVTTGKTTEKL
jgi:hypothetical protein